MRPSCGRLCVLWVLSLCSRPSRDRGDMEAPRASMSRSHIWQIPSLLLPPKPHCHLHDQLPTASKTYKVILLKPDLIMLSSNKIKLTEPHKLGGWKQEKCLSHSLEAGSLRSRCWQGWAPSESCREDPSLSPPAPGVAGNPRCSWACGSITQPLSLLSRVCLRLFSSSWEPCWARAHPEDLSFASLHLQSLFPKTATFTNTGG